MFRKIVLLFIGAILVLALAGSARASVLMSDDFTYSDGNLVPNNGGYSAGGGDGWGSAWQVAADFPCDPTDIIISGNQVTNNTPIPGIIQGVERDIDSAQGATTQYFAWDMRRYPGSPAVGLWGVAIDIPGGGGPTAIVYCYPVGAGWQTGGNIITGGVAGSGVYAADLTHRMVARIDFDKGGVNDELTVWVNPAAEGDTPQFTHHLHDMGGTLNGLTMQIIGRDIYAEPTWAMDRLNLTTTFAEAKNGDVPEPATLGVLVLGALAGLLRRRR